MILDYLLVLVRIKLAMLLKVISETNQEVRGHLYLKLGKIRESIKRC